jgi:hypothetical protein
MDGGEEVACGLVVTCGDGAELLEFGEEIFGKVSRFIEVLIKVARRQATSSRRDDGWFAGGGEGLAYTVIGLEGLSAIRTSAAR